MMELKGSKTSLGVLKYFYSQCKGIEFDIYSLTLNKKRLYAHLTKDKERVYNYVVRLAMDKIPLEAAHSRIYLVGESLGNTKNAIWSGLMCFGKKRSGMTAYICHKMKMSAPCRLEVS